MGLSSWKDKYRISGDAWSLERFVEIAGELLESLGIDDAGVPNERLVRYYTAEGAMRKPVRDGREVRYRYEHLVEFLVTRMLLKDGWPLSKVSGFVSTNDFPALEQMIPEERLTDAQRELRSIKRTMSRAEKSFAEREESLMMMPNFLDADTKRVASFGELGSDFAPPTSASQEMLQLQGTMAQRRSSLAHLLHSIGFGKHKPEWKETANIDLTPWCRVSIDAEQLRRLPNSVIEPLGQALSQALREHRMSSRRDRK